jgi:ABC-type transporter Mla subunit MlaD
MRPLWIASAVILVTVFVVYYAFNQGVPLVGQYTDYAIVNNSVNVRSDSPVRIAGIDVGAVQSTSPDGQYTKIAFTMQGNGLPLHTDATVTIRDRLFLEGGYYLQLDPGSPDAPLAPEGFVIQPQNTSSPVQFYKVLSTFNQSARTSLEDLLNTANTAFSPRPGAAESDSGAGGLKAALTQVTPLLEDVSWVSQALRGTTAMDVERLLTYGSDVTSTLNADGTHLTSLIAGLDRASGALAATDSALAQTVSGIAGVLRVAPAALSAIDGSLPPVTQLARALTPSLKLAPPLVSAISTTVGEVNAIVTPARRGPLIGSLKTTFTTFPKVLTQLSGAFPVTKAVTDCLARNVVPVLDSSVQDGSLSTHQPAWKDFLHFLPIIAGASAGFDGDGHLTRTLAGAGNNSLTGGLADTLTGVLNGATKLVGISPGGGTLTGAAPHWIGTLTAADFRPDVPCTSQAVPALTPTAGGRGLSPANDLRPVHTSAPRVTPATIAAALARAAGRTTGGAR